MTGAKSHLDPTRTNALGMLRYGIEFYAAAVAADDVLGAEEGYETFAPIPVNYLVGHAIELGLKAYLLQQGWHPKQTKELGHDLVKALQEAEVVALGQHMAITDEDRQFIAMVNDLYSGKQFEYIETGFKTFPVFGPLQRFAHDLLLTVVKVVPNATGLLHRRAGEVLTRMA